MSMKQILSALLRLASQKSAPEPKPKRRRKLSHQRKPRAGVRRLDPSRPLFQQIRNLQRGWK